MIGVIEYLLEEQEIKKQRRFKIVKELLSFTAENNGFKVNDRDIVNIAKGASDFEIEKSRVVYDEFVDNLINFFLKIVYYYENNKFDRFNFILEAEAGLNNSLKSWIKRNKISILNICEYYSKGSLNEKRELVFSNNYLEITKLHKIRSKEWGIPKGNSDGIEIRIPLKGEIYYKNGLLLKEREYLLSSATAKLDKYKVLTDEVLLLIIKLKKEFINKIKIKELTELKHQTLTVDETSMRGLLDNTLFREAFTFFMDIVIILLEINELVNTNIMSVSLLLYNEEEMIKIIRIIDKNIALPEEKIKEKIERELGYTYKKIEEIVYKGSKLTLKKFILKEKTKYIIEEYANNMITNPEELLKKYSYSNIKNLRYNIKNFYDISIKDIKRIKI